MNGHVQPPQLTHFTFHKKVPAGTSPVEPGSIDLLSVTNEIPSWGRLVSFETTILRDGQQALDMHTYSFGVTPVGGKLIVKFQIVDRQVATIADHEYDVTAQIHYYPD